MTNYEFIKKMSIAEMEMMLYCFILPWIHRDEKMKKKAIKDIQEFLRREVQ